MGPVLPMVLHWVGLSVALRRNMLCKVLESASQLFLLETGALASQLLAHICNYPNFACVRDSYVGPSYNSGSL